MDKRGGGIGIIKGDVNLSYLRNIFSRGQIRLFQTLHIKSVFFFPNCIQSIQQTYFNPRMLFKLSSSTILAAATLALMANQAEALPLSFRMQRSADMQESFFKSSQYNGVSAGFNAAHHHLFRRLFGKSSAPKPSTASSASSRKSSTSGSSLSKSNLHATTTTTGTHTNPLSSSPTSATATTPLSKNQQKKLNKKKRTEGLKKSKQAKEEKAALSSSSKTKADRAASLPKTASEKGFKDISPAVPINRHSSSSDQFHAEDLQHDAAPPPKKKGNKFGALLAGAGAGVGSTLLQSGASFDVGGKQIGFNPMEGLKVSLPPKDPNAVAGGTSSADSMGSTGGFGGASGSGSSDLSSTGRADSGVSADASASSTSTKGKGLRTASSDESDQTLATTTSEATAATSEATAAAASEATAAVAEKS